MSSLKSRSLLWVLGYFQPASLCQKDRYEIKCTISNKRYKTLREGTKLKRKYAKQQTIHLETLFCVFFSLWKNSKHIFFFIFSYFFSINRRTIRNIFFRRNSDRFVQFPVSWNYKNTKLSTLFGAHALQESSCYLPLSKYT